MRQSVVLRDLKFILQQMYETSSALVVRVSQENQPLTTTYEVLENAKENQKQVQPLQRDFPVLGCRRADDPNTRAAEVMTIGKLR